MRRSIWILFVVFSLGGCGGGTPWNDPYPGADASGNTLYSAFTARPKHLDPAKSYAEDEAVFTAQIYQPPLQYHYLLRPYRLIPFAAESMPRARLYDAAGHELAADAPGPEVAYSVYDIHIRPGLRYQPHPCFAKDKEGRFLYHRLSDAQLAGIQTLADFPRTGSREVVAADFVHEIKRLASPQVGSPIFGLMSQYIVGMKEFAADLAKGGQEGFADLEAHAISGVEVVDRYHYRIKIQGKYPQFVYWLAMAFMAPVPPEADRFYAQPGLIARNISLDWYPVGSGPYMLTVNDPNRRMVLARNPNFGGEAYPSEGSEEDRREGLLEDAGKPLPLIDRAVFTLEKESIPYWNKFLQGYYDASGISSDSFDQAVSFQGGGEATVSPDMAAKGIGLQTSVATSSMYLGFNMLDPVVGGYGERRRKLRQAISIAIDFDEFISIFANGRGLTAQGPIPPGIFGYSEGREGLDSYVFDWVGGAPVRKSVAEARRLLAEAGYPNGRDAATGQPLVIYLDTTMTGLGAKARLDWLARQFGKLDIQMVARSTDWNRFQDKIRKGSAQLFFMGWNADYPDPENFLFLFNGPQAKAKTGGENAVNYDRPEYNRLFEEMKNMADGPERLAIIRRMVAMLQEDAPWIWGYYPVNFTLAHRWLKNRKPNAMANNSLKYQRIEPGMRTESRRLWNRPRVWPLLAGAGFLLVFLLPAVAAWRRRERETGRC